MCSASSCPAHSNPGRTIERRGERGGAGDDSHSGTRRGRGFWQLMRERAERTRPQIRVSHRRAWAASVGKATILMPKPWRLSRSCRRIALCKSMGKNYKFASYPPPPRTLASFAPHYLTQKTSGAPASYARHTMSLLGAPPEIQRSDGVPLTVPKLSDSIVHRVVALHASGTTFLDHPGRVDGRRRRSTVKCVSC